jgi:hypothetical protein
MPTILRVGFTKINLMTGDNETKMSDELGKSRQEINDLIYEAQILNSKKDKASLVKYNQMLLKINEKQINLCSRLALIKSKASIQELDELAYGLEQYMGKALDQSSIDYYKGVKKQLRNKLTQLTGCNWRD